ncbi:MAG: indole-3-glycerol phosphate synthase TrpC [Coprococcus sp.]
MAADILEKIAADKRIQIEEEKKQISLFDMKQKAYSTKGKLPEFIFEDTLKKDGISFICEVKKASPSKGVIAEDFPYVDIAKEYEAAGADCLSVLTEEKYFQGSDKYLQEIRQAVDIPILRKDFTIDVYQIYQAKVIGADAVLLICALLDVEFMKQCIGICNELGMSALVEAHDEHEVKMAIEAGARVIGVNNRNLKDFTVDIMNSVRLRSLIPEEVCAVNKSTDCQSVDRANGKSVNTKMVYVSESGIKTADDVARLRENKTDAVLIGETFMKSPDKKAMLESLKGAIH